MEDDLRIIRVDEDHISIVLELIRELSVFERMEDQVVATAETLRTSLLGPDRMAESVVAYWREEPVGFALFFHNFSTFVGRPGLYLEDLYVRPAYRGKGIGLHLMRYLAGLAIERKCRRFEWAVLNWNEKAIQFYEALGAAAMSEWTVYRLSGDALSRLAQRE